MKAIFYDRKNKREVSSDQLMGTKLVEEYVVVDGDGYPNNTRFDPNNYESFIKERTIGELGYKSEKCDKIYNWDLWTNTNELVFLRLEE